MAGGKGHPLPGSGEARHHEIPERLEQGKGTGQDPEAVVTPHPDGVNPDGEPYRYDDLGRGSPEDKGLDDRPPVDGSDLEADQRAHQDRGQSAIEED